MTTTASHPELTPEEETALHALTEARREVALTEDLNATFDGDELLIVAAGAGYHVQVALNDDAIRNLIAYVERERQTSQELEAIAARRRQELCMEP